MRANKRWRRRRDVIANKGTAVVRVQHSFGKAVVRYRPRTNVALGQPAKR